MSNKLPYPEHLSRGYPPGVTPDRWKIIKCSDSKLWYAKKVGQIITVNYFTTFGAWDTEGRWLWYYDLSKSINMKLTYENVKYGMLVEVLDKDGGGYHSGCKVHFFNKKGVLVGNYYEFLPYERLRVREDYPKLNRQFPRYFYPKRFEKIKMVFFRIALSITGQMIRFTQRKMD